MYGFVLTLNGNGAKSKKLYNAQKIECENFQCEFSRMNKFEKDKLFFESDGITYLLDGVIFNKKELMDRFSSEDWETTYETIVKENTEEFINELRGSFCGFVYNQKNSEIVTFTNHSGERAVFYYAKNDLLIVANHMELMYEALVQNGEQVIPNIQGNYEMLATGSCLHGNTLIEDVHRITAGKRMIYNDGSVTLKRYHMFRNVPEHELSLDECIDEADRLFRKAIDRIFSKNLEYGYKAEADLSGGLDSRLATWVAHDLGYTDILNVCYCQKGRIDHLTSSKIAKHLGNEYFFYPMDHGEFLMDVDEMTSKTGGDIVYCLCSGANRAFNIIDHSNIGLAVTGLLGEIHNAYWTEGDKHTPPAYTKVRYTNTIKIAIPDAYCEEYDNYEQMNLYEFSDLFFLSSTFARQDRCEVYSPFIDKDFMEFAYRIPLKWRKNYFFTINWILKKYPEAAKFVWQTKKKPIDKAYYNKVYLPKIGWDIQDFIIRVYNKFCRMAKINSQIALKDDMNPMQLWYDSNSKLRNFFEEYYKENCFLIKNDDLAHDIDKMFSSGICRDKVLVVNLLSIYKKYFND